MEKLEWRLHPPRWREWRDGQRARDLGDQPVALFSQLHLGVPDLRLWLHEAYQQRLLQHQYFWPCCYFVVCRAGFGSSSSLLWAQQGFLMSIKNMFMTPTERLDRIAWLQILAVPLTCYVILDQLLKQSVVCFLNCKMGIIIVYISQGCFERLDESVFVKCLQCTYHMVNTIEVFV